MDKYSPLDLRTLVIDQLDELLPDVDQRHLPLPEECQRSEAARKALAGDVLLQVGLCAELLTMLKNPKQQLFKAARVLFRPVGSTAPRTLLVPETPDLEDGSTMAPRCELTSIPETAALSDKDEDDFAMKPKGSRLYLTIPRVFPPGEPLSQSETSTSDESFFGKVGRKAKTGRRKMRTSTPRPKATATKRASSPDKENREGQDGKEGKDDTDPFSYQVPLVQSQEVVNKALKKSLKYQEQSAKEEPGRTIQAPKRCAGDQGAKSKSGKKARVQKEM